MIEIFDVYQYTYYNQKNSEDYPELQQYMVNNRITLTEDEMILSGRIIDGVIGVGDKLFQKDNNHILCVKNIYCYGQEFDYLSEGMFCAIKVVLSEQADKLINLKLLYKNRKQNILAKGLEYWTTTIDGAIYKEVNNPKITEQLEKMVSYIGNNGDLFIQKILENNELYHSLSLWKDKYNVGQTVYQILNELQVDSLNFWLEEDIVTIMFSVSDKGNYLFGHYIQTDFDMEWKLVGCCIC